MAFFTAHVDISSLVYDVGRHDAVVVVAEMGALHRLEGSVPEEVVELDAGVWPASEPGVGSGQVGAVVIVLEGLERLAEVSRRVRCTYAVLRVCGGRGAVVKGLHEVERFQIGPLGGIHDAGASMVGRYAPFRQSPDLERVESVLRGL